MIYQIANGDTTKYKEVEEINDIDDFYLWLSFKNRENNIEKYFMSKDRGDNTTQSTTKKTFNDHKSVCDYYNSRKQGC